LFSEVDNVLASQDDVLVPIEDLDVWIDPLDATQVRIYYRNKNSFLITGNISTNF
jgi:hypothetical protein